MSKGQKKAPDLKSEVLAGYNDNDQGHKDKLNRYGKAKRHQRSVLQFILKENPELVKESELLKECSNRLIFRNWYTVNKYRLIGGCTCKKHLLCAMCALRRSAKTVKEVEKKVKIVLSENPNLVPVLITMTIKNGDDLNERYNHFTSAKKKLLQKRRNALKAKTRIKNKTVTQHIHGSFGSYEFKKGSNSESWHPHTHEIALVDETLEFTKHKVKSKDGERVIYSAKHFQESLSKEWHDLTGDSYIVDVRKIENNDENDLIKAICEASKYALKLNDIDLEDQIEAYKVLSGRRLTFSYGSLFGIKIPEDLNDDIEEELKLLPYIDIIYGFYDGQYIIQDVTDTGTTLTGGKEHPNKKKPKIRKNKGSRFSGAMERYLMNPDNRNLTVTSKYDKSEGYPF